MDPNHKTKQIAHFLRLREIDPEYARWAMAQYINDPDCPYPSVEQEVKAAWANRNQPTKGASNEPV